MCISVLDLNECTAKPGTCKNGRCENTVGSYRCRCDQGFIANPTQTECIGTYVVINLYMLLLLYVFLHCALTYLPYCTLTRITVQCRF